MPSRTIRLAVGCALAGLAAASLSWRPAQAQDADEYPYLAATTADDVDVRCGAHFRYYSFGRLREGDLVQVLGIKAEWARVATVGPAFEGFFGFLRYPTSESGGVVLSADGASALTTGRTDVFAPNLDNKYQPKSSWKPLVTLEPNRTLQVLQTFQSRDERVHKVALPEDAQGWVKLEQLRRATPTERVAWEAALNTGEPGRPGGSLAAGDAGAPPAATPPEDAASQGALAIAGQGEAPAPPGLEGPRPVPAASDGPLGPIDPQGPGSPTGTTGAITAGQAAEPTGTLQGDPAAQTEEVPARTVAPAAPRAAISRLKDLEASYMRLLEQSVEQAETEPLRLMYLDLARQYQEHRAITEYATGRARQLELWSEAQRQKTDLIGLREKADRTAQEAREASWRLEAHGRYVAVGRLDASSVYNGKRLPRLFRLRDPESGRTVGYLEPDEKLSYTPFLGEVVGIEGDLAYDGKLRLNVIRAQRIERLGAQPVGEGAEAPAAPGDTPATVPG